MFRPQRRFFLFITLLVGLGLSLDATQLPNCAGTGTVDTNIEDGIVVPTSICAVLDQNIDTITGDIFVDDGGTLFIYGDISHVTGEIRIGAGSTLHIFGNIGLLDGKLQNDAGTINLYGDIALDDDVNINAPATLNMFGGNLNLISGKFTLSGAGAVINMNHGSTVTVQDSLKDFDNKGGSSEVQSDGSGNTVVTPLFTGPTGTLTCSGSNCTDSPALPAGFLIQETNDRTVTFESGLTDEISMVLTQTTDDDVIVNLLSSDLAEFTVSPASLTFTSLNWMVPQTITLTGVDDSVEDGTKAGFVITSNATSANADYNGFVVPDIGVLNRDNGVNGASVYNVPPSATNGTYSTNEDAERYLTFAELGYSDPEGDPMEKIKISVLPAGGVVFVDDVLVNGVYDVGEELQPGEEVTKTEIDAGIFGFLPELDENGIGLDSFGFQPQDGTSFSGSIATITFDVAAVNDPPTIVIPADQVVNEDDFITGIPFNVDEGGISDEDVQSLTVTITSSDQTIVQDANIVHDYVDNGVSSADVDGPYFIDITPELDAFGEVTITFTVQDDGTGDLTSVEFFTLNVRPVNDMPSFTPGLDVAEIEDYGFYSEVWATDVLAGPANESSQVLNFVVTNDNNALFSVQPAIAADGTLTFTTAPDAFGLADVDVYLTDDGGRLLTGVDTSPTVTFTIELTAQNDPPTGADQAVNMAAAATAVPETFYNFDETDFSDQFQDVDLDVFDGIRIISSSVPGARLRYPAQVTPLVTIPINIAAGDIGDLYFEIPESSAVMSFTFKVQDENGAFSTETYTMFIVVGAPNIPTANDITTDIDEDTDHAFTALEFETEYSHPDAVAMDAIKITSLETVGTLKFDGIDVTLNQIINNSQLDLLTYEPNVNENGSPYDSFDFTVFDASGNESASAYTYTFNVISLNDAPTFALGDDQFVYDDDGAQSIPGFLTAQDDGDPDVAQNLSVVISNSDNSLFTVQPSIDPISGELTYTPADEAQGLAIVSVDLMDNGGTPNGGTDTSETQTFKITILDAPEAVPTTIPAGSYIVDMGISPQTFANGLYPFGLVYDLTSNYSVPISIAINFGKAKDGIDFTHESVNYRGAPFIISAEYITQEIQDVITSWEDNGVKVGGPGEPGIQGNYTTLDATNVPIFVTFSTFPKWTLDVDNGSLVGQFFDNALIPAEAYQTAYPYELDETDDIFVLPHADPTWDDHSNLYYWSQSLENGGQGGWIWAGCHAVSVLENLSNPINPSERMNFLSDPGLILFGGHAEGTSPYTYRYPTHQFMQFIGTFDGSTENGSEQTYLPLLGGKWNASSQIAMYDSDHPDIPGDSPGEAAKMVFGPAFSDPSNGVVLYQGGHDLNNGTEAEKVAAQRAFFNFSFLAPISKVPTASAFLVPEEMGQGQSYSLLIDALARDGSTPTYEWRSSCGGSFDDITSPTPIYIPPVVTSTTECIITVVITDDQGRQTFQSAVTTILSSETPTFTSFSASVDNTLEETEVEITFAELLAGSDATDEDGTIEKFIVQLISTGTLNIGGTSGTATPFDVDTNNTIDASNNAYWTPDVDDNGTIDTFEVIVEDDASVLSVGNVIAQIGVTAVNDDPTITDVVDQNTNEDTDITGISFTVDEGGGVDEDIQILLITATSDDQTLIPDANITVNYTDNGASSADALSPTIDVSPANDQTGAATITITVQDDGSGTPSVIDTFLVTVNAINDDPTITTIADQVTNEDTDIIGISFTVDEGGVSDEDIQTLTVLATSDNLTLIPNANITVNYTDNGASSADALSPTIDISPAADRNGTATITVTVQDSGTGTPSIIETFLVTVNAVPEYTASAISGNTNESGTTATFTVVLDSQPLTDVVFDVTSGDTGEGTVDLATLTFTNADWNMAQTVTVTGVDESLVDGDITYNITIAVNDAASDDAFDPLIDQTVAVTNEDDDVAGFTASAISGNTSETGTTATFTVVLDAQPLTDVVFDVISGDTGEGTVDQATLTFTNANWNVAQTVTVTGIDEALVDGDITYNVAVTVVDSSSDDAFDGLATQNVSVTNTDDDTAGFTASAISGNTSETGTTATFTVVLDAQPLTDVVFDVISGDTGEGTVDQATLTFTNANWNVAQTVTVTGIDEALVDGDITYNVAVTVVDASSDDAFDGLATQNVSVTNTDDDVASFMITETSGTTIVTEAGSTDTFDVVLGAQPSADVIINIGNGDAAEISLDKATLTFTNANWNVAQTVTVTGVDEAIDDGDATTTVTLSVDGSSDGGFTGLANQTVSVTTTDDDAPGFTILPVSGLTVSETGTSATFTIDIQSEPTADVQVDFTSNNTFEGTVSPGTFTFNSINWMTTQTITVTGVDDALVDGDVNFMIITADAISTDPSYSGMTIVDVSVTNTDDEVAGFTASAISGNTSETGTTATFTVVLDEQPLTDVVLDVISGDTGEGTVDQATLTFTNGNWNVAQTVTVTGIDDASVDGNITYNVSVTVVDASSDDAFDGLATQNVSVTNTDDDAAGFTASAISGNTNESGTTATFTVVLTSQPLTDVVFDVTSGDLGEGTVDQSFLTFTNANWSSAQTVTVTGVDESLVDGDITYNITVAVNDVASDDAFDPLADQIVTVTNEDDDTAGFTASAISGNTSETGTTATFTVVLDAQPLTDVVFDVISGDTGEGTVDQATLTFTNANWNVAQTVTVTGIDEALVDGDITYNVAVTVVDASSDDAFDGLATQNVSVTNTDDDTAGFTASAISGNTSETGTTATFTVVLDAQPLTDVVFDVISGDTGEGTVDQATLTFTNANWNVAQTVTVTGIDEALVDGDITYNVAVTVVDASSDDAFDGLATQNVSVTNTDDDTAGFTASAISGNTSETGTTATFTVVLDAQPLTDVVFDVISGDTGEGTVDQATLTFTNANWNVAQTVTVTGIDDASVDGDITYNITVAVNDAASDDAFDPLIDQTVAVTNEEDDVAGFTASAISGNTNESGTTATFTVVLGSQPLTDVVFDVTSGDTGEGTVDLATLTFTNADWNMAQTVTVTGVDESLVDGDITYNITVAVNDAASDDAFDPLADQTVAVTNEDDDVAGFTASAISGNTNESGTTATYTVVLDSQPLTGVVFDVTSGDTGEGTVDLATLTFTNADWNMAQTVTVTGVDESLVDGDITYNITVAVNDAASDDAFDPLADQTVAVTNEDDDVAGFTASAISGNTNESGTTATFTVVLDSQPLTGVVFDVTSGDTGEGTVDLATLTFTNADWNMAQTVTVTGVDESLVDGDITYNITVAVNDAASDDAFDPLADQTVAVTNEDDDVAGFTASAISGNTNESGTTATFTVVLDSQPLTGVVFDVTSGDAGEGTVDQSTLTFTNANWNMAQTVTVTGVDESILDGDITYNITVAVNDAASDAAFDPLADQTVTVTNEDDDVPSFLITESSGTTVVSEAGSTDTFDVVLGAQPAIDVIIDLNNGDATEISLDLSTMTFTNANWNLPQAVTVNSVDDAIDDGDVISIITLSVNGSSDVAFVGLPNQVVNATTTDDDIASIVVTETGGTTEIFEEGMTTDSFDVVLTSEPSNNVVLNLTNSDDSEASVDKNSLTFTSTDWDIPQAVSITAVDDIEQDGDINFTITISVDASLSDDAFDGLSDLVINVNSIDNDEAIKISARKGFSPNGDGKNDFWAIEGIENYPENTLKIFNRWGRMIKTYNNYDNEVTKWSGESDVRNNDVEDGTYFFILEGKNIKKPISGYIIVSR